MEESRLSNANTMVGGWKPSPVTPEAMDNLEKAMQLKKSKVCFQSITSLEEQVVAGLNYRFHVEACNKPHTITGGNCELLGIQCTPSRYVIEIYVQQWANIAQITSITRDSSVESVPLANYKAHMQDSETVPINGINMYVFCSLVGIFLVGMIMAGRSRLRNRWRRKTNGYTTIAEDTNINDVN